MVHYQLKLHPAQHFSLVCRDTLDMGLQEINSVEISYEAKQAMLCH